MKIRIGTFNTENLFARYNFREGKESLATDGFTINDLAFTLYSESSKKITAQAIKEVDPDIICLQEVENMSVLERFNSRYLARLRYKHRILVDSHDPRFIDVAFLSKYPIDKITTYRNLRNKKNTTWLFSRDCLEVEFKINGKKLVLYGNHFKSMMGGRDNTKERRLEQVEKVAEIITEKWGHKNYKGNFIVLGDFNDYIDSNTSLSPLMDHEGLVNTTENMDEEDSWTHFWATGNEYRQLDYILISKSLSEINDTLPGIMRKGLPYKAENYNGSRFDDVGENHPKASDHALIYIDLEII
jgi:endonuclease/exonuclease/phosphatase family metal-dependent hydrolase